MKIIIAIVSILVLWSIWGYFFSNVEQADYTVVSKTSDYEVRDYPEHIVAQTTVKGSYKESLNQGFTIVAGYIFGANSKKESIAMTAPVLSEKTDNKEGPSEKIAMTAPVLASIEGENRTIAFGMPRTYTLDSLPIPTDPRVEIKVIPAKKFAVLKFSWYSSEKRVNKMKEALLSALKDDGVKVVGKEPLYAGYNGPGTPPWMIRNEVLIEIE